MNTIKTPNSDPPSYVIPFGKYKNKTLEQIDITDLKNYAVFLTRSAQEQQKDMTPKVANFVERVRNRAFQECLSYAFSLHAEHRMEHK